MVSFTTTLLVAAGAASTVYAEHGAHARHQDLHERQLPAYMAKPHPAPSGASSCGCYSYTTTWYGAPTFIPDLRDYSNTTSAGWETVVAPEATSTSISTASSTSISNESSGEGTSTTHMPSATSSVSTLEHDAKSSSSDPASSSETSKFHVPTVYGKKASDTTCTSDATSDVPSSPTTEVFSYSARSSIPYTASSNAAPTLASSSASSYAAPSSSSTSSSASSYVAPSSSSTSSSASPSSTTVDGTITPNGNKWAFCYTPYASDGNCKTADAVATDIAAIKAKGFTSVRLYASDCDGPQNVGAAAAEQGLKLILGIWIDESGIGSNTDTQIETLTKWGKDQWDLVEMVVAGNEAMFYGYTSAEGLAGFVNDVRSKFRAAGYNGPVGTSEVPGTLIQYADVLCPAIDFVGANVHPFFDANIEASGAGDFVVKMLDKVSKACNDEKVAYNLESGWPSLGSANGLAVPGAEDQRIAISSIMEKAGAKTAMFSFDNDTWKAPGEFGVEQHWGCANVFD